MYRAMILCAGFGSRMGELTNNTPKPMLLLGNKPLIEHTILHLKKFNITEIIINLHYLHEQITDHLGNGEKFGVNIHYSYEELPLGTAGAVKKAQDILAKSDNFLLIYGDVITNLNYKDFLDYHKTVNSISTIILHKRAKSNSIVELDSNNRIINFIERPDEEQLRNKKQNWVNSGIYCFTKEVFNYIPEGKSDFPRDVFPSLIKQKALYGFPLNGYRCAVDSPDRYFMLQSDFNKGLIF